MVHGQISKACWQPWSRGVASKHDGALQIGNAVARLLHGEKGSIADLMVHHARADTLFEHKGDAPGWRDAGD